MNTFQFNIISFIGSFHLLKGKWEYFLDENTCGEQEGDIEETTSGRAGYTPE